LTHIGTKDTHELKDIVDLRVGVVYLAENDGIASALSLSLEELGLKPYNLVFDEIIPPHLDAIIARGFYGSLVPISNRLISIPPSKRPLFILWQIEQLPNPALPEWFRYGFGKLRSRLERFAYRKGDNEVWRLNPRLRWMTTKALRFRYYGDLYWFKQQGILSILAMGSPITGNFLRQRGFDLFVTPISYQPGWGADLELERDIPVLWIGKIATYRRKRLLERVRSDLSKHGVEVLMIDGVENPYIFGEERTVLLNRTKVVLNFLRKPWDNNCMRFSFAALNGALILTEPTLPHTPFLDGVHLVEAPIEKMADEVMYYLSHEGERTKIVEQAHQLITTTSKVTVVSQILEQVLRLMNSSKSFI
jgi:hypothetical protein